MTEKITMIELFSGIGAQERALRQIGVPYEVVATCDLDKDAVLSYAAMRNDFENEFTNYNFPSTDKMIEELQSKNVGFDFGKGKHTITTRTPVDKLKQYYLADKLSKNLGDISVLSKLPYADMVTYSFPCTDLSVAGKGEGMTNKCDKCGHIWPIDFSIAESDVVCPNCGNTEVKSTRSGLLGEVQRLLSVSKEEDNLPKYLLLENVKNLVGKKFKPQFLAWINWLDSIGYNTYYEVLNAKHYGIPQNRERVFALSIRKDIDNETFKFPDKITLTTRLKDFLEKNVDEKFYLPDERVSKILENWSSKNSEPSIIKAVQLESSFDQSGRVYDPNGVSPTIMSNSHGKTSGGYTSPKVVVEEPFIVASRGRNPENPSDRTTGAPTEQRLEPNFSGCTNTLTSVQKDNYVCEPQVLRAERTEYGKAIRKQYESGEVYEKIGNMRELHPRTDGVSNTITTLQKDNYVAEPIIYDDYNSRISSDQEAINTLTTNCGASAERNGVKILEPIVCEERRDEGIRFFKDDCVGTLRTIDACGDKRVIEPDVNPQLVGGIGEKNFGKQYRQGNRVYDSSTVAMALNAQPVGNTGGYSYLYVVEDEPSLVQIGTLDGNGHEIRRRVYDESGISPTLCGVGQGGNTEPKVLTHNIKWRIRKLTTKCCWRLMGFTDEDHDRAAKYVSASALYKQAGNSICTCCLVAIFNALFLNDYTTSYEEKLVDYNKS